MPLLRLAEERDGWVTPEAIEEIGAILGLSSAEVLAVVSNPIHRQPIGYLTEAYALRRYNRELEQRRQEEYGDDALFSVSRPRV